MPLAGFMVSQGKFSLIGIIAAGTAGSVLGALPFYYIGRCINEERLKGLADRYGRWLTGQPQTKTSRNSAALPLHFCPTCPS